MKEAILTKNAPAAIGPYSQAVKNQGIMYISGQLPIVPETGVFAEGGIREQTRQSLSNVLAILKENSLDMSHVLKSTVFLDNMDDFTAMNEVYATFFQEPYPARAAVEVARLPKGALVEVEVVAAG